MVASLAALLPDAIAFRLRESRYLRKRRSKALGKTGIKILVVHPHYPGKPEIRYMPLGLATVAGVAEHEGHDVHVCDLLNRALPYSALERELRRGNYDLVMSGGFAMQVASMREIVRRVRQFSPRTKVLLGGVGVSDIPEIALDYTGADGVCTHEAEMVLPEMLRAVQEGRSWHNSKGIVFRDADGTIVKRPGGALPERLDELPYAAYHLFDIKNIAPRSYNGWGAKKSIHIMTSRGCPFRCTFCINSLLNDKDYKLEAFGGELTGSKKSLRHRSPESVVKEINFLKARYGITDFHFADEEFITHTDHLLEMCAALKTAKVTWSTSGRADWVNEVKLKAMKEAGCRFVIFGIESGSQKMVDMMEKRAKVERAAEGLVACYKVGMRFIPNFMIGHPGETKETIAETLEFCKALKLPYSPAFVTPFPNSKMFHDNKQKLGDWKAYFEKLANVDYNKHVFSQLSDLTAEELMEARTVGERETKALAATEYFVDYSEKIDPARWGALPPAGGPAVRELPAMFRKKGQAKPVKDDGFAESLVGLEA